MYVCTGTYSTSWTKGNSRWHRCTRSLTELLNKPKQVHWSFEVTNCTVHYTGAYITAVGIQLCCCEGLQFYPYQACVTVKRRNWIQLGNGQNESQITKLRNYPEKTTSMANFHKGCCKEYPKLTRSKSHALKQAILHWTGRSVARDLSLNFQSVQQDAHHSHRHHPPHPPFTHPPRLQSMTLYHSLLTRV